MEISFYEHLGLFEGVELANVEQSQILGHIATNHVVGTDLQVEVHDGEPLGPRLQQREHLSLIHI